MINNFIFCLGLPGSGKSTYFNKYFSKAHHIVDEAGTCEAYWTFSNLESLYKALWINVEEFLKGHKDSTIIVSADEIKHILPGYTPEHPEVVHELSVQHARRLIYDIAESTDCTCNVILDGGGINNHYNLDIINKLREYKVNKITCLFFDTPVDVCIERLQKRPRKVPIEDVYKKNQRIEACKNRYIPLVDDFIRIDYFTNKYLFLDMDGTIASYGKAKLDINGNTDFVNSELFKNLKPVKHIIEFVKEQYDMNNVYIVTACPNSIAWKEKCEWLDKHFPEIPEDHRMFVGNKDYKHVFIEQFAMKMKFKKYDICVIDDLHETLTKCENIGVNAVHPSNIYAMVDKYSYQA